MLPQKIGLLGGTPPPKKGNHDYPPPSGPDLAKVCYPYTITSTTKKQLPMQDNIESQRISKKVDFQKVPRRRHMQKIIKISN